MGVFRDLSGLRFGRLIVIEKGLRGRRVEWVCHCDCGNQVRVLSHHLTRAGQSTVSCGCKKAADLLTRVTTHGMSGTRTHSSWASMLDRCRNRRNKRFYDYGGRGITVCDRWDRFENFLEDMGPRPPMRTLERLNNSFGYFPANCWWATPREQQRNMRRNRILTINGKSMCLTDAAQSVGLKPTCLSTRLRRGWDLGRSISEPVHQKGGQS